jgi:5-methyltetrahydrofolate--homocysteine methyltransferase
LETMLSSASREVYIGGSRPTVLIGERINPTGKKWLQEALQTGDLEVVRREAVATSMREPMGSMRPSCFPA